MDKKQYVQEHLGKGRLLSPHLVSEAPPAACPDGAVYINQDLLAHPELAQLNWPEFERARQEFETGRPERYQAFLSSASPRKRAPGVKVLVSHPEGSAKFSVEDFTLHFNARLEALSKILYNRDELKTATAISRVLQKKQRESVAVIGMVMEKDLTKKGSLMLKIEDSTEAIKVLVSNQKPELFEQAKELVLDEVIGVSGVCGERIIFANALYWPDVPLTNELKRAPEEGIALFLSDLHVGSDHFLEQDFERFLAWVRGEAGTEAQRQLAKKVKYIFLVGDIAAGVGVYPGQEQDLTLPDVKEQYRRTAELLRRIPQHITLIMCAGNHDAVRLAEPQPPLANEFTEALRLPNLIQVSNPSLVNIHASEGFPGFNVLVYHGYSFDYYVANVDSIRNSGGYDRADLIMRFLLKRRHLAPAHTSAPSIPTAEKDPLVIDAVPDFFVSGHIHKTAVSNYRNVTLIMSSCWESKTAYQEKVGHNPEPSRVPAVDLRTREVKILKFGK